MKKLITMILCVLTVCSLAACGSKSANNENNEIPNPFIDCNTLEDAAKIAGFDITIPDAIDEYTGRTIQAVDKDLIQVIYKNDDSEISIRKGTGSDDISGDNNKYAETSTVTVGDLQVTFKGGDGKVKLATWTNGNYTYAAFVGTDEAGLSKTTMIDIINSIDNTQIPNPFVDCDTLADAAKLTGFDLTASDSVDGYDTRTIQVMDKSMIQVIYANGDDSLMLRKGAGTDDISGDNTEYAETNTVTVGSLQVNMKGEGGMVSVAVWTDGGYTYAVDTQSVPMSSEAITQLIASIH